MSSQPQSTLRRVVYADTFVKKRNMSLHEKEVYEQLRLYRNQLREGSLKLTIPELIAFDRKHTTGHLSFIGDFLHPGLAEYFGRSRRYSRDYLEKMVASFELIRRTIPVHAVKGIQYDEYCKGQISVLDYLEKGHTGQEPKAFRTSYDTVRHIVEVSQATTMQLPLFVAHRDPNISNYIITEKEVCIIDWETAGSSPVGYDEGRLMTYLVLNPPAARKLLDIVNSRLSEKELIYFWRVVAVRAYREMLSIAQKRYHDRYDLSDTAQLQQLSEAIISKQQVMIDRSLMMVSHLEQRLHDTKHLRRVVARAY